MALNDAVASVLAGRDSYDDLSDEDQEVVRAHWDRQVAADVASLGFTHALSASGKPFYSADAEGTVVTHGADERR